MVIARPGTITEWTDVTRTYLQPRLVQLVSRWRNIVRESPYILRSPAAPRCSSNVFETGLIFSDWQLVLAKCRPFNDRLEEEGGGILYLKRLSTIFRTRAHSVAYGWRRFSTSVSLFCLSFSPHGSRWFSVLGLLTADSVPTAIPQELNPTCERSVLVMPVSLPPPPT